MRKLLPFILIILCNANVISDNLIKNDGFEIKSEKTNRGCFLYFSKDWEIILNSGASKVAAKLSEDAHSGKYSLELINKVPKAFVAAYQTVKINPGDEITASVWVKGNEGVKSHNRFYFYDKNGKQIGKYKAMSIMAPPQWAKLQTRIVAPEKAATLKVSLENLLSKKAGSLLCDDYTLTVASGTTLENRYLKASVNTMVGGCIDSVNLKNKKTNLTMPNSINSAGGLAVDIIPGNKYPGVCRSSKYDYLVIEPKRKIKVWTTAPAPVKGLLVEKVFSLKDNSQKIDVAVTFTNKSAKEMQFLYRVQNIVPLEKGVFTWPTNDWLKAYKQTLSKMTSLSGTTTNTLKRGWMAKSNDDNKYSNIFIFDLNTTSQAYNYFGEQFDTAEWFYNKISLAPGKKWSCKYALAFIENIGEVFYCDRNIVFGINRAKNGNSGAVNAGLLEGTTKGEFKVNGNNVAADLTTGRTVSIKGVKTPVRANFDSLKATLDTARYKTEYIKPVKLPAPPSLSSLPEKLRRYFPFSIDSPPLSFPEAAGTYKNTYNNLFMRLMRELRMAGFNTIHSGRLLQESYLKQGLGSNGIHNAGEYARKYDIMLVPICLLYYRSDDVEMKKYQQALDERWKLYFGDKSKAFIKKYNDRILCYFTADETLPKDIPAMLLSHKRLAEVDPNNIGFPYLNLSRDEYMPYVGVYFGDWYPIKKAVDGGRNPWSTQSMMRKTVKKAGKKTPVWLMPQGFGYMDTVYGFSTPAEMKLMLYGAVANGCKGIAFHGYAGMPSWRNKYGYHFNYFMSFPHYPLWNAMSECARQFTSIGPSLLDTFPEDNYQDYDVSVGSYKAPGGFYNGPAVKVYCLKINAKDGRFLIAVNQNINKEETFTIKLKESAGQEMLYDLTHMRNLDEKRKNSFTLQPGGAIFMYVGNKKLGKQIEHDIYGKLYENELAKYMIMADMMKANNFNVSKSQASFEQAGKYAAIQKNEAAYKSISSARNELKAEIKNSELGEFYKAWQQAKVKLSQMEFKLATHFKIVMPPAEFKAAQKYKRFNNKSAPELQALVNHIGEDCYNVNRLERLLYDGKFAEIKTQMENILPKIDYDCKKISAYLQANANDQVVVKPFKP